MKAYITKNEVNKIFEELDFELSDECIKKDNHIHENVFNYLEDKWDNDKNVDNDLVNVGKKLLREFDEN